MVNDTVITTKEACQLLKLCRITLLKKVRNGEIPGKKVGHNYRFSKAQLIKWIEKGQKA